MASRQEVAQALEEASGAWVEITDRANKEPDGPWALGRRLWSPERARGGADTYRLMRRPEPGDLVLHFVDEGGVRGRELAGTSRVKASVETTEETPPRAGVWANAGRFLVVDLEGYEPVEPPLSIADLIRRRPDDLMSADRGEGNFPFARRSDGVRTQLQYLTRATPPLLRMLAGELRGGAVAYEIEREKPGANLWRGGDVTPGLASILTEKFEAHARSTAYLARLSVWYATFREEIGEGEPVILVLGPGGFTGRIGSVKPQHQRLVWLLRDHEVNDVAARRAMVDAFAQRPALRTVLCVRPEPSAPDGLVIADWGLRRPDPLIDRLREGGAAFASVTPYQADPGPAVAPPVTAAAVKAAQTPLDDLDWSEISLEDVVRRAGIDGAEEPVLRALAALASGMNVIFVGPPGTGKTTLASAIFEAAGVGYDLRCASDHWTTYDTIGGYFPEPDEEGRSRLAFRAGALLQSMQDDRCVIIDEINRADIDKAFGELFTLFGSKQPVELRLPLKARSGEGDLREVVLAKAGVEGALPAPDPDTYRIEAAASWRLIGSMNDADRASLKRFSLAFARRFAMIPVRIPAPTRFRDLVRARGLAESERVGGVPSDQLERLFELANGIFIEPDGLAALGAPLGPGFAITVLDQAVSEFARAPRRGVERAFLSALELYVAPQFQGLATKHHELMDLVRRVSRAEPDAVEAFEEALVAWTGGPVAF